MCPRDWMYVVSSFSLVLKNIFISAFISLFIQSTFKCHLFSFHEVMQFWVSFLILSSNLDCTVLWETVMISILFHLLMEWFTSNYVVNFRVGAMQCWECIFCGFGVESSVMSIRSTWSRSKFKSWISVLIFCPLICLILTVGC